MTWQRDTPVRHQGEGTKVELKTYTEKEVKEKFPNPNDPTPEGRSGEPGLRDYRKSENYKLIEPGAREWNWSQF